MRKLSSQGHQAAGQSFCVNVWSHTVWVAGDVLKWGSDRSVRDVIVLPQKFSAFLHHLTC